MADFNKTSINYFDKKNIDNSKLSEKKIDFLLNNHKPHNQSNKNKNISNYFLHKDYIIGQYKKCYKIAVYNAVVIIPKKFVHQCKKDKNYYMVGLVPSHYYWVSTKCDGKIELKHQWSLTVYKLFSKIELICLYYYKKVKNEIDELLKLGHKLNDERKKMHDEIIDIVKKENENKQNAHKLTIGEQKKITFAEPPGSFEDDLEKSNQEKWDEEILWD